jgi:hypothetical protein
MHESDGLGIASECARAAIVRDEEAARNARRLCFEAFQAERVQKPASANEALQTAALIEAQERRCGAEHGKVSKEPVEDEVSQKTRDGRTLRRAGANDLRSCGLVTASRPSSTALINAMRPRGLDVSTNVSK